MSKKTVVVSLALMGAIAAYAEADVATVSPCRQASFIARDGGPERRELHGV